MLHSPWLNSLLCFSPPHCLCGHPHMLMWTVKTVSHCWQLCDLLFAEVPAMKQVDGAVAIPGQPHGLITALQMFHAPWYFTDICFSSVIVASPFCYTFSYTLSLILQYSLWFCRYWKYKPVCDAVILLRIKTKSLLTPALEVSQQDASSPC